MESDLGFSDIDGIEVGGAYSLGQIQKLRLTCRIDWMAPASP